MSHYVKNNNHPSNNRNVRNGNQIGNTVRRSTENNYLRSGSGGGSEINVKYGVVISVLESFGFIQTYDGEDNVYFSVHDKDSNTIIRPGDEIEFQVRAGARGLVASNM